MRRLCAALVALAAQGAGADTAAITSQTAGMLTLIDTDSAAVIVTVPLPGNPAAVALDRARGRILAVAVDTGLLHVFDLTGQPLAHHPVNGAPFGLAIRPGTGTALITDQTGTLRELDPLTGEELTQWTTGAMPSGVAASNDLIVTADRDSDSLTLIQNGATRTLPVGHHPFGVTLHDGLIFAANVLDNTVSVLDSATGTLRATIPTGERPYAVAFASGRGFVSNQYDSSVTVFDTAFNVVATFATGDYPEGIAATADGNLIVVANWFDDIVTLIDAQTLTITAEIVVPPGPRAFGNFTGAP